LIILGFLFSISCPGEVDVSVFPAFSYEYQTENEQWECNFLYPLFQSSGSKDHTKITVPFIFSLEDKKEPEGFLVDIVWPLFTYRKKPRPGGAGMHSKLFLFPFFFNSKKAEEGKEAKRGFFFPLLYYGKDKNDHVYFILIPFIWYAKDTDIYFPFPFLKPQSYLAFLPFFGVFKNLAGNELIRTYFWPLFIRVYHKGRKKFHFFWPFFGYGTGEKYKAYRFWPLFVWAKRPDGSVRMNYLWPFGYHRRKPLEGDKHRSLDMFFPIFIRFRSEREKWDYYFPFYGRKITPIRSQWAFLWPLFKTSYFLETGAREVTLLAFIFQIKNDDNDRIFRIFPLCGRRLKPGKTRSYILWPLYQYKFDDLDTYTFSRYYLFPFYLRKVWDWKDKEKEVHTMLFPFYFSSQKGEEESETTGMHLFYHDKAEAIERNWCSLLPFYRSKKMGSGDFTLRIFWKLYHREHSAENDLWELNPLIFQWKQKNKTKEFNILGGLFGIKREPKKTSVKLLYIPLF